MYTREIDYNDPAESLLNRSWGARMQCLVENYSPVKAGDKIIIINLERLNRGKKKELFKNKEIFADRDGYFLSSTGKENELYSIAESEEELSWFIPHCTDFSSLRIDKELRENRYYYTLKGIPSNILDGLYNMRIVARLEPEYELSWLIKVIFYTENDTEDFETLHEFTIEEPFRVEVKKVSFGQFHSMNDQLIEDGDYYMVKNFAIGYPKRNQLPVMSTPEKMKPGSNSDACYVYVMRNEENGAYKIGISNDPKYREHTLQSQEPNVNIVFCCEFPTRDAAFQVESEMHNKYSKYRIRGEWFAIPHSIIPQVYMSIVQRRGV